MLSTQSLDNPLTGFRVLDLSRVLSGPVCGRILSDMGADVIKVEAPEGDILRQMLPSTNGTSHIYAQFNAGKRHICIDMKQEAGCALVAELAERCDVLLENFRPGVVDRLGIGATAMLARNPRLVYCSISGWGQDGPWSGRPAYAPMVHAEMGTLKLAADLHDSAIRQEVHHHADLYSGTLASSAILAALVQLARTGSGQHLDICMAEVMLYMNEYASSGDYSGPPSVDSFTFEVVSLADGTLVNLIGHPQRMFPQWVTALGTPDLTEDPRFHTPENLQENPGAALSVLRALFRQVPDLAALDRAFTPHGLLFSTVRSTEDALETDWASEREVVTELEPGLRIPRAPWRSSSQVRAAPDSPGHLGADNAEVLREILALEPSRIESLVRDGVVCDHDTHDHGIH